MKSGRKNLRVSSSDEVTGGKSQKKRRKAPENEYLEEILELKKTIEHWDNLFSESADETRMNDWLRIEVLGEPLMKKFAWVGVFIYFYICDYTLNFRPYLTTRH